MVSTDFRSKIESAPEASVDEVVNKPIDTAQTPNVTKVETPYLAYEDETGTPFVVDYYELGNLWNKDKAYTAEVMDIESFIKGKIKAKEVANALSAVKSYLRGLEITVGAKDHEPKATRMNKLLNYIETINADTE